MKLRVRLFAATVTVATLLLVGARSLPAQPPDEAAIRATVQLYFDGIMTYDEALLRQAFLGDAVLLASLPRGLYRAPLDEWLAFARGSAPTDTTGYSNRIISIDQDGNAAVVKTDLQWPRVHYIDYLSLLKIRGEWKIVNKIWHQEAVE